MITNDLLENFKKAVKNKKVGVIGIGISNIPAIKYLHNLGARITALDRNETLSDEAKELKESGVQFILGDKYLDSLCDFDYILRSPGVKPFTPQIEEAIKKGAKLTSEIELLIELAPCKIIGITGSDGKTTTTTLTAKFLEQAGFKVWLGGNIGTPLFNKLDEMQPEDVIVLELSSFQLMTLTKSPNISIVTNISPNHLDYHRSYDEYIEAKENIFLYQQEGKVIFNKDDNMTNKFLNDITSKDVSCDTSFFSLLPSDQKGVFYDNGAIYYNSGLDKTLIEHKDNIRLVGMHNIANICAAASAVISFAGSQSIDAIKNVITTFDGVKHRMQYIKTVNGVTWYNDSIGTSPSRTMAGLKSFEEKIILIAGGYDKNIPYDVLGKPILDNVKELVLLGKTAPKIEEAVRNAEKELNIPSNELLNITTLNSLEECVNYCHQIAKHGDIVVMSPASASFDMYKNFEQRGDHFISLVNGLN
ncbi:MAG: UDP-N-acetylmuramoyl-L-alanine--D-glutamate ligase [Clostridia bacterium]|nr:UDP-N-acetylmuramoyl-L-alanine--D-glutamate ligase [Clostridia bacterium]